MTRNFIIAAIVVVVAFVAIKLFADGYRSYVQNGDVNMDGQICIDDSVQIIYHLWRDGRELPCPDAADLDRNGYIDVNDVVMGLRFLFFGDPIQDCPFNCDSGY